MESVRKPPRRFWQSWGGRKAVSPLRSATAVQKVPFSAPRRLKNHPVSMRFRAFARRLVRINERVRVGLAAAAAHVREAQRGARLARQWHRPVLRVPETKGSVLEL